jgi:hypothetical protein
MAVSVGEAVAQTDTRRSARVKKFSGVEEIVFECTTSDSTAGFVDMPGMTRNFRLAGSGAVVVMFHGAASLALGPALTSDTGYVQLQIDGVVQSPGDQIPFISTESATPLISAYSFTWQSERLSSGRHTALRVLRRCAVTDRPAQVISGPRARSPRSTAQVGAGRR